MLARILGWMKRPAAAMLIGVWSVSMLASGPPTQTRRVMQRKLVQSEQLLAALVTSNWAAFDRQGRALRALTDDPGWDVLRLPEFQTYTAAFDRSADAVIQAAGRRDQREALAAYNGLVASCVECHRYLARARITNAK